MLPLTGAATAREQYHSKSVDGSTCNKSTHTVLYIQYIYNGFCPLAKMILGVADASRKSIVTARRPLLYLNTVERGGGGGANTQTLSETTPRSQGQISSG